MGGCFAKEGLFIGCPLSSVQVPVGDRQVKKQGHDRTSRREHDGNISGVKESIRKVRRWENESEKERN